MSPAVRTLATTLLLVSLACWAAAAPAPEPFPEPAPYPAADPSPIWRLFGGYGGYGGGYNRGGYGGGYGQRGGRAYNGPPPEGPNEYKSICRVNNPDNYAFGPGHIPAGPVCPW